MPIAPTQPVLQKSFMQKRIPTLIGLGFLVIGLVVGVVFLGKGAGIFAPRAAPETKPRLHFQFHSLLMKVQLAHLPLVLLKKI